MTEPYQQRSRPAFILLVALLVYACAPQLHGAQAAHRMPREPLLSAGFLLGDEVLPMPLATQAYTPSDVAVLPQDAFNGLLTLSADDASSSIETLVDTYEAAGKTQMKLASLPPFSFEFVSDGSSIVPVKRGPQRSNHPYWEIILEPGQAWTDAADKGWSRAALPFSLKEKNQNCTHNGLLTFVYRGDGSISRVAWQIASETCLYLKVNSWGVSHAEYAPGPVSASGEVIAAYRREVAARLPVKPFAALGVDYPGLDPNAFQPSGIEDASVYGFVLNGVHYRSECPTRFGPYPFCDVLDLPSYSLAKSIFAGLDYFLLAGRWPGFARTPVSGLIPECRLEDGRWDKVTPEHLINMATGNYDSALYNADEDNGMDDFFVAESHADKLRFSCAAWPNKAAAGTQWVYHTTDTYLLGVAMNNFLKQKLGPGADIYRDLLYPEILETLDLSPLLQWTQRTYDGASQPFTGYGLVFHSDDLARLALALNTDTGVSRMLAATEFDSAMFRTASPWPKPPSGNGLAYSNGFWGVDASGWVGCSEATWIPFMSGYGGIAVTLLPGGGVYYFFTDSNQHTFRKAVVEADKVLNYCKE